MSRKPKWKLLAFKLMKFKLYDETAKRYKALCISKGRTIQEDLESYVINQLK